MSIKIIHITEPAIDEAELFGEMVLKPKWEKLMKAAAIKRFAKIGVTVIDDQSNPNEYVNETTSGDERLDKGRALPGKTLSQ